MDKIIKNDDKAALTQCDDFGIILGGSGIENGDTLLIRACRYNAVKIANYLVLDKQVNVNQEKENGVFALFVAAQEGYDVLVKLLLEHGAEPNKKSAESTNESTPLHQAAFNGRLKCAELLLAHGANPNIKNKSGEMPLMYAVHEGHHNIVALLVENGATIGFRDNDGNTALMYALSRGQLNIAKLLITNAQISEINICNTDGQSALVLAIAKQYMPIVQLLIEKGADCNLPHPNGVSPLCMAIKIDNPTIVKLLLDRGANLGVCNIFDKVGSPLHLAASSKEANSGVILRMIADAMGANTNIDFKINHEITSLIAAVTHGNKMAAEFLISRKANINVNCMELTPIYVAVSNDDIPMVELLIKNGADLNVKVGERNLMDFAIEKNNTKIIDMLKNPTKVKEEKTGWFSSWFK